MKQKTMVEKKYEAYTTNDGFIVSKFFSMPLQTKREINKLRGWNNMPNGDRTGPKGKGPKTGRGRGGCWSEQNKLDKKFIYEF